ncbi:hypothetical protein PQE75_gp054 [Bacillus phage vB_BcoS-136]|uniref:Uncharacterized protein n=1 Tax=Bacillus phage vB_BcoS-136 TaxID=2419619 RepID=A0A3G3BVV1_9CAUD|nr:hypothetical protein PQE75_gp054 [Bacillus phage vB_BcoS-136]AYP68186.1 hypothetical protein vBBcoS136_00054 [Bacillus phage vB_BcoS-136]
MNYNKMLSQLEEKVKNAKLEIDNHGLIDGVFSHMIGEEINVRTTDKDDILVSICPYSLDFDSGEMCLGLFGIDNDGVVDLISATPSATEMDLEIIYNKMKEIENQGYYTHAIDWGIFG